MIRNIVLFLVLNFGALAIGGLFTSSGVSSEWYQHLNKAPWTPPGWVFSAAWTTIMFCFAIYMAYLLKIQTGKKRILTLFAIQWILNISWNPIFFHFQNALLGMISISMLTVLVAYLFYSYRKELAVKSLFLLPYVVWLLIATSLNAFILFSN